MDTRLYLNQLKYLVENMLDMDLEDRIRTYAAIKTLADELEEHAREEHTGNGYIIEKIGDLLWSTSSIAGLSDGNQKGDSQHQRWAMTALSTLEGSLCFGREG